MPNMLAKKTRLSCLIVIAVALFALDMLSKAWVNSYFEEGALHSSLYPYGGIGVFRNVLGIDFCINRVTNLGGAWGLFSTYPYLLMAVRLGIVSIFLIYALFFNANRARDFPFLLILVGASGNLFDFFFYGHVIDFLHFMLWGYSFPVFNLADTMIFLGIACLFIYSFRKKDGVSISHQSACR